MIFVWPLLIYLNSLHGGYVLDDAIVISQNQYTQQGISGLPGIFSNDSFYGFFKADGKAHLVGAGIDILIFSLDANYEMGITEMYRNSDVSRPNMFNLTVGFKF